MSKVKTVIGGSCDHSSIHNPFQPRKFGLKPIEIVFPIHSPGLKTRAMDCIKNVGFSPILDLIEKSQAVKFSIQQFSHPISAADISRQFVEGKKGANVAREQQIGHIPETIFTFGLLRKTGKGLYVRQRGRLT